MIKTEYNIGIIGCGKMGKDLFNFLSGFPIPLTLVCKTEASVIQTKSSFNKKQNRALKFGLIDQGAFDFRKANTHFTTDLSRLKETNLIIESINEDLELKRKLIKQLQKVISSECIVASNSSSIPPDILFKGILKGERSLGIHFFYPISQKDIVEVNQGEKTSEKTILIVKSFLQRINKFYIILSHKHPFIINRMFLKMQAGCCQILNEGELDVEEIDAMVKAHLFPIGIFEFFDHVGNDVMLHSVRNYIKYEIDQDFYQRLLKYLENKVKKGKLGIKTNSGFYNYPIKENDRAEDIQNIESLIKKITLWYLDGIYDGLNKTDLSELEMAHIVMEYMMVEKSPFELAKEIRYTPK